METSKVIPNELMNRNQWVLWKLEEDINKRTGEIKYTKVPYQTNGIKASSTNRNEWTSYNEALKYVNKYDGVGFVFSDDDPYTMIDLDGCIIGGQIKQDSQSIVDSLNSFTEVSQSGEGLHIIVEAEKTGDRSKNPARGFEMYDKSRFIALTGDHIKGTPQTINEAQTTVNFLYDNYFPQKEIKHEPKKVSHSTPTMSDDEILKIALNAKNGNKINDLLKGKFSSYGSQSEADQALCNMLAFYTRDFEQIDRIFSNSGLYRDKWDREDYKTNTINKAINDVKVTYQLRQEFQVNDRKNMGLKAMLQDRRKLEIESMLQEWESNGKKGQKPKRLSPLKCAEILQEHVNFILFDLEENTRVAMYQPKEGVYTRNTTLIKRVISWLEPSLNNYGAEDVIYHLTNKAEIRKPTNSRYLIPVKNGIFNLKTKKLEPFSPSYVFTTKIATKYIESPNKPFLDGWDIDTWLGSIACGDTGVINLLWQVISDSLNGNYSRKKGIFLVGDGNNGKGTFQELITNLIGMNNIASLKVNQFEERFQLGVLEGKTAVIGDDVPANVYIEDSSNFNSVVTGDVVQVEIKNKQPYNTVFRCSVIQSTNGMPKFRNKTNGTLRRVLIVPFKADFNGEEENFKIKNEYIKDEKVLQYVLYKAINMDFEKFDIPNASTQAIESFTVDNDPVIDFKCSVFDEWNIPAVPKKVVYSFYKMFCVDNGYKYLSNREFHNRFEKQLGNDWDGSKKKRFRYNDLINYVGDMDKMGIGFPDCSSPIVYYKKL